MPLLFLLIHVHTSLALASDIFFHPVTTINSRTTKKGTLYLGRAPIGNINSTFFTSSLNYGVFSRLEIGTSPIFYLSQGHKYNYVAKINFWRGDWVDWSFVAGSLVYRTKIATTTGQTEKPDLQMNASQIAFNLHPPGLDWAFGASFTQSCGHLESKDIFVKTISYRCEIEHGLDIQYQMKKGHWLTAGSGRMREAGISPFEKTVSGLGAAYTWKRANQFLSRPSVGFYIPRTGELLYLFSTTFYEND